MFGEAEKLIAQVLSLHIEYMHQITVPYSIDMNNCDMSTKN
jgi:hypothetical protein